MALLARMLEYGFDRAAQRTAKLYRLPKSDQSPNFAIVQPELTASTHAVPAGECVYAIGDIHGKLDLLDNLIVQIRADAAAFPDEKKTLVFLGDYIDRGPDSAGVIDYMLHRLPPDFIKIFLRGNHEDYALKFLRGDLEAGYRWLQFGGAAFLASYGVSPYRLGAAGQNMEMLHDQLLAKMPIEHREFLDATQYQHGCGDYYFVHAGVRPQVDLERQETHDKMWIREDFLNSNYDFGKMIVHGHSVAPDPVQMANRIGIDTGAYATGRLAALRLRSATRHFLAT